MRKQGHAPRFLKVKGLLPFEVWPSAQQTIDDLRELVAEEEECLDSNLRRFEVKVDDGGKVYLEGEYTRVNGNLRSVENQRPIPVCLHNIKNIRNEVKRQALRECRIVPEKLVQEVEDQFLMSQGIVSLCKHLRIHYFAFQFHSQQQ